jgi:hypothetical protein
MWTTRHPVDNSRPVVGSQAEAAAELVPDDELVDFAFEEEPDDDDPSPALVFFSAGFDELEEESPELDATAVFDGSDFFDDSESLPAALRLSLR